MPSNKYFHRLAEPPHFRSPMLNETNCTYMRVYAHPVASVSQMCTLMFTSSFAPWEFQTKLLYYFFLSNNKSNLHSVSRTHLHMHDTHNTCECMHTPRKNAYGLVHARLCNGAEASLPWKLLRTYVESCASIMQAVVGHLLLPSLLLCRLKPTPNAVRSRNPSKSTLAHDAVADAVLHKHHSFIRVGAGLIQFVHGSHSHFATGFTSSRILIWPFFRATFISSVGFQAWDQGILHVWNVWCQTRPSQAGPVRDVRNALISSTFSQITGLVLSLFKYLLSSFLVFFPFWGFTVFSQQRYFQSACENGYSRLLPTLKCRP